MRAQFLEKRMTLLKFSDVSLAFGAMPLLDKVSWQIARGERVCIIGRNGTGKSSMMKLVKGDQKPDEGSVWRAPGLKIGELPRNCRWPTDGQCSTWSPKASTALASCSPSTITWRRTASPKKIWTS